MINKTKVTSQQQDIKNTGQQKPHTKYRNIIFDVGNVLLEWNPTKIVATVLAKNPNAKLDLNEMIKFTRSADWVNWDMGLATQQELKQVIPAHLDKQSCIDFIHEVPYSLTPLEEGIQILKTVKAKGYNVYILSTMPKECLPVIKSNNFFELFDGEIFSCDAHIVKPDPAIYQALLSKYNLNPDECLFIDDLPVNIEAANALGIDGIVCQDHKLVIEEMKRLNILD